MAIGQVVGDALRDSDVVARYGGEEFLVIASQTSLAGAANLAERLRQRIAAHDFPLSDESNGVLEGGGDSQHRCGSVW